MGRCGGPLMKISRRILLHWTAGAAAVLAVTRVARAQNYPARPIRLVIPFPPGGAYDLVGRPLADKLKPLLGTVVIENIGGGGASLGAAAVVRAPADGYTILLGGTQTHLNEALLKSRPLFDPVKDLDPIASVATNCLVVAVHPSVPVGTLKELIGYAKANPGKLSYGHAGVGSIQHLTGELFKSLAETPDIVQVPYRGTGPAIADLVSGQVPMGIVGVTGAMLEFHRSGKTRIVAVTNPTRLSVAPELPTAAEQGLPRANRDRYDRAARAGENAELDRGTDRARDARGGRRPGVSTGVGRRGDRAHARTRRLKNSDTRWRPTWRCGRQSSKHWG